MDWEDYVKSEHNKINGLSDLKITFGDDVNEWFHTPSIIKVSVELLNRLFEAGEKHVLMVFPEKTQSTFFLSVLKVINDIYDGISEKIYNPNEFVKGQKLKCGKCVVEFSKIDKFNGKVMLWVKSASCDHGIPIELAPFFQLTDTNKPLSKDEKFLITKADINKHKAELSGSEQLISILSDYKTHINNTVFTVGPTGKAKELTSDISINCIKIKDLLLIGQADIEGNVEIINKGQFSGKPAIVLASDMYTVYEAIKKESEVKSLFIDVSNPLTINNELDVLDELMKLKFPIICMADTSNSFELEALEMRGFCVWRWDEESISSVLYDDIAVTIDKKVKNCAEQKIEYIKCESEEISGSLLKLYNYRKEVADTTANMIDVFNKLFSLAFLCLRNIVELTNDEYLKINKEILDCKIKLHNEKRFISSSMFNDLEEVISTFQVIYNREFVMPKISAIRDILYANKYSNVCIVIHDREDKEKYQAYFKEVSSKANLGIKVNILKQSEYINFEVNKCEITIVCGWLSYKNMKDIIFSYKTTKYLILLYDYEERWKNPHIKSWNRVLQKCNKRKIIEKALPKIIVDTSRFKEEKVAIPTGQDNNDELFEIEMVLKDNWYRKYLSNSGIRNTNELVEALPVNFVGGSLAFYKSTHKLVSVTDIVLEEKDYIKMILPAELKIGDFIVVRESQHDLIKEFADVILSNSGKSGLRELATKWKETLLLESIFSSFEDIYLKLKKAGCTKSKITIKQWMKNDDIICPQNFDDLKYIAVATEDNVLLEQLDLIFNSGIEVKRAHIQAGKKLSELLKRKIAQKIQEFGVIDPYNIWEPITLFLDEIGTIKILKVIDLGNVMMVDSSTINNLISEY